MLNRLFIAEECLHGKKEPRRLPLNTSGGRRFACQRLSTPVSIQFSGHNRSWQCSAFSTPLSWGLSDEAEDLQHYTLPPWSDTALLTFIRS